jgi:hypothetical protein
MAKRQKLLAARRSEAVDDSVLIRSAETLGRMIGSLQRQLDGATKRFTGPADDAAGTVLVRGNGHSGRGKSVGITGAKTQGRARAARTGRASSVATKQPSTAPRKSKRASASVRSASARASKKK